MNYIEFSNKGEIPVNAFKLLGASTKRNDSSKIGFFGTGLKYALAVLLREGIPVRIFIGEKELNIGLRKTKFGTETVQVVTINGEKTSLTTDAGIDWEMWFAVREIYSNTLDENGEMETVDSLSPEAGYTKIYVDPKKLGDIFENWGNYFAQGRESLHDGRVGRILAKQGDNFTMFRKGIRVFTRRVPSLFDYDSTVIQINESRVAKNSWEPYQRACEMLASCTSEAIIQDFVDASEIAEKTPEFWEYMFDSLNGQFSEAWYEVLKNKRIVPEENAGFYGVTKGSVILPKKLVNRLAKQFKERLDIAGTGTEHYKLVECSEMHMLDEPLRMLETIGLGYDKEKIKVGKFKDEDCMGVYDRDMDRVVISEEMFKISNSDDLFNVVFEEVVHARTGYSDNTRVFQSFIIDVACKTIQALDRVKK